MKRPFQYYTRLQRSRKRRGVSKYRLAKRVGVTEAAVRAWETGRCSEPSFSLGLKIAKELHEDADFLAFDSEVS
jgi:transcriptional regulator with XRE-family HTH domain